MKGFKKILATVSAAVFALTATTIPVAQPQTQIVAEAATMKLNKKSLTLEEGETYKLKVKGKGKKKVKWSSSDDDVVMVTTSGKIVAVGNGKATIKAKVGKKVFKCKITVIKQEDEEDDSNDNSTSSNNSGSNNDQNNTTIVTESYFARLKNYINTNGTYNDDMEKEIEYKFDRDTEEYSSISLTLTNSSDGDISITLYCGVLNEDFDYYSLYSSFDLRENDRVSFIYQRMAYYYATIYTADYYGFNPANYIEGANSVDFSITDNSYDLTNYDLQKYANEFFDATVDYANEYLKNKVGFGLKELGFTNL